MTNLSHDEIKQKAKNSGIKNYKSQPVDKLSNILNKTEEAEKKTKAVGDIKKEKSDSNKILRDIRTLYESEEDYYEPVKISSAFNSNYTEYESNGEKDKTSIKEYLDLIKQYLSDII